MPNHSHKSDTAFADAMRRLVRVPLAEVVAEEKKWKAMRKRLKKKGEAKGGKRRRD
jgi:hypothetical protein